MPHRGALSAGLDLGAGRDLARHPRGVGLGEVLERLRVAGAVALLDRLVAGRAVEEAAELAAAAVRAALALVALPLPLHLASRLALRRLLDLAGGRGALPLPRAHPHGNRGAQDERQREC